MVVDSRRARIPIFAPSSIDLEVDQYSFSTHAGHQEIVEFATQCQAEDVVIYHQTQRHGSLPMYLRQMGIVFTPWKIICVF